MTQILGILLAFTASALMMLARRFPQPLWSVVVGLSVLSLLLAVWLGFH